MRIKEKDKRLLTWTRILNSFIFFFVSIIKNGIECTQKNILCKLMIYIIDSTYKICFILRIEKR